LRASRSGNTLVTLKYRCPLPSTTFQNIDTVADTILELVQIDLMSKPLERKDSGYMSTSDMPDQKKERKERPLNE
jgi:hypothetical protein